MKLEKFKEKDSKKKGIILFTISCMVLIIGVYFSSSFALFETKEVFNLIEGNIENIGDLSFTYYIDGQIALASPEKNSGKAFDSSGSYCTNDANLRWDYEEWGAVVTNIPSTKTKCFLKFKTEYKEDLLNGTDPVLKEGLVPVTIEADGTVKKADRSSKWYSYFERNWANAVILKDETISYKANEVIPEENIESYFVWIPKYRYQLGNIEKYPTQTAIDTSVVKTISLIFGVYTTKDYDREDTECATPMESGLNGNCKVGDFMTPPAFLSIPSNGFWVGKFETSRNGGGPTNVINSDGVQIKPNVSSWRNINVSNAFYTSYNYKRNLDSHMMKNTEWGAVAYLQHSKFGSHTSLRINNHKDCVTGYASKTEPVCGLEYTEVECNNSCNDGTCNEPYNTNIGITASTTGNITGIYDMSGGAWEYTMGVLVDQTGKPMSGRNSLKNSGFKGPLGCPNCDEDTSGITSIENGYDWPLEKYYDKYNYSSKYLNYENRILGDATGEMGPFGLDYEKKTVSSWYTDYIIQVFNNFPWSERGSAYLGGAEAGMFAQAPYYGNEAESTTFRIVLTP